MKYLGFLIAALVFIGTASEAYGKRYRSGFKSSFSKRSSSWSKSKSKRSYFKKKPTKVAPLKKPSTPVVPVKKFKPKTSVSKTKSYFPTKRRVVNQRPPRVITRTYIREVPGRSGSDFFGNFAMGMLAYHLFFDNKGNQITANQCQANPDSCKVVEKKQIENAPVSTGTTASSKDAVSVDTSEYEFIE